jgi:hypothetical protein
MPSLPPLAHMSTVLRHGMTSDEFYAACDELMENYQLRVGTPTLDMNVVSIAVQEGSHLLCFLNEGKLVYVEYKGGVFLDEETAPGTALVSVEPRRRGCLPVLAATLGLLLAALSLVGRSVPLS